MVTHSTWKVLEWKLYSTHKSLQFRGGLQYGGMITHRCSHILQDWDSFDAWKMRRRPSGAMADTNSQPYVRRAAAVWRVGLDADRPVAILPQSPATSEYTAKCFCLVFVSLNIWLTQSTDTARQDNYVGPMCLRRLLCSRKQMIKNSIIKFSIIV